MTIFLPGVRGLFSHMQELLCHVEEKGVDLTRGVHQALVDLRWLAEDLSRCPTRMYELVPLQPKLDGYNKASRYMCEGAVLLGPTAVPQTPQQPPITAATSLDPSGAHPIVWRTHFTVDITAQLVSWGNPEVKVTNSDLDLAGSVIHHACMAECFDIHGWTRLYCTDSTAGL